MERPSHHGIQIPSDPDPQFDERVVASATDSAVQSLTPSRPEVGSGSNDLNSTFLPNVIPAAGFTDEDLEEFRRIWKQEFNEELSGDAARLQASLLLELYLRLAKPLPGNKLPE